MLRGLQRFFFIVVLPLAATLYFLFAPSHAETLLYKGEFTTIRRDSSNIPTITAPSRRGFFYALGRVHAEDRLFQMCFKLLVVQGRLAEHLGELPLPMDRLMREVNLYEWGQRTAQRLQR